MWEISLYTSHHRDESQSLFRLDDDGIHAIFHGEYNLLVLDIQELIEQEPARTGERKEMKEWSINILIEVYFAIFPTCGEGL